VAAKGWVAWTSGTSSRTSSCCLQYGGATSDGRLWLEHFTRVADNDKRCIFDHYDDVTVPLPAGVDVSANDLAGWTADAGLGTSAPRIAEAIGARTDESAVDGLVRALGLVPVDMVYPAVQLDDLDWWECWQRADDAGVRVIQEWNARRRGDLRPSPGRPPAGADEFIRSWTGSPTRCSVPVSPERSCAPRRHGCWRPTRSRSHKRSGGVETLAVRRAAMSTFAREACQLAGTAPPACQVFQGTFQSPYPSQVGIVGPPVSV
jgi:hypothetical protein